MPPEGLRQRVWESVERATLAQPASPSIRYTPRGALVASGIMAASLVALAALLLPHLSDSSAVRDPADIVSTTHTPGILSDQPVVRLSWSPRPGVRGYSVVWSALSRELPDRTVDIDGSAGAAESPALPAGHWYFHLRTQGTDGSWTSTVHIGPFVVVAAASPTPGGSAAPAVSTPTTTSSSGATASSTPAEATATMLTANLTPAPAPSVPPTATPTAGPTSSPTTVPTPAAPSVIPTATPAATVTPQQPPTPSPQPTEVATPPPSPESSPPPDPGGGHET